MLTDSATGRGTALIYNLVDVPVNVGLFHTGHFLVFYAFYL